MVAVVGEVELCEDVADVRFDRSGGEPESLADSTVGEPLGEELKNLAFAVGQFSEFIVPARAAGPLAGVDDGIAAADAIDRVEEDVDFGDAIFEQVAAMGRLGLNQLDCVVDVYVL